MKSFKKYITEDFPFISGIRGQDDDPAIGYPIEPHLELPKIARNIGHFKIGDEVFHFHDYKEPEKERRPKWVLPPDSIGFITKLVNGKHEVVGHTRFSPEDHEAIGYHYQATDPTLKKDHRKKGLMSELYQRWANSNRQILRSGHHQSHGGRNIWDELAQKGDVRVMDELKDKHQSFPRYDPKTTPKEIANSGESTFVYFPEGRKQ